MELSKEVYDIVTRSRASSKVIQMISPEQDQNRSVVVIEDGETLEIGLSREVYLTMFKQVHKQWHSWNGEMTDLWRLYYMTLGYLITTHENHTILRLHEQIVRQLYDDVNDEFLVQEFEMITVILSSRLKRINKSSCLWYYMKKLTILIIFQKQWYEKLPILIDRVFNSCKFHFANYYANNFLKWIIGISYAFGVNDVIGPRLIQECKSNLKDISLWSTLETWLYIGNNLHHYIHEYETISNQLIDSKFELSQASALKPPSHKDSWKLQLQEVDNLFLWLMNVNCCIKYPYVTLFNVIDRSNTNPAKYVQLLQNYREKIEDSVSQLQDSGSIAYKTQDTLLSTLNSILTR